MKIPSKDTWTREEFIEARRRQLLADKRNNAAARFGLKVTYVDMGDKILCDSCGAEITTKLINLVEYGRRVACTKCFNKSYASEPIKYRRLTTRGTLGEEVTNGTD